MPGKIHPDSPDAAGAAVSTAVPMPPDLTREFVPETDSVPALTAPGINPAPSVALSEMNSVPEPADPETDSAPGLAGPEMESFPDSVGPEMDSVQASADAAVDPDSARTPLASDISVQNSDRISADSAENSRLAPTSSVRHSDFPLAAGSEMNSVRASTDLGMNFHLALDLCPMPVLPFSPYFLPILLPQAPAALSPCGRSS